MIEAYKLFWKNFANFNGRARRRDYWLAYLANVIIAVVLMVLPMLVEPLAIVFAILSIVFGLAILVPMLAISWRRLHDIGKSGVWYFIMFVPIVGFIWYIILLCKDSEPDNQYSPNPKAGA